MRKCPLRYSGKGYSLGGDQSQADAGRSSETTVKKIVFYDGDLQDVKEQSCETVFNFKIISNLENVLSLEFVISSAFLLYSTHFLYLFLIYRQLSLLSAVKNVYFKYTQN